jgi:hypothetical protein
MSERPVDRRRLSAGVLTSGVLSLAAVSLVMLSGPAQAQRYDPRYPVCMTVYSGPFGGEWIDCSYDSLPQCRASASGRSAMCSINPYFVTAPGVPRFHRHHRRAG